MFLSTFSVDLISDLYVYDSFPNGIIGFPKGRTVIGDEPIHAYRWDVSAMNVDDGYNVLRPTSIISSLPGRWLRSSSSDSTISIYTGTTNASGNYTITYPVVLSAIPHINPVLQAGTNTQILKVTANTTTGFTVQVVNRVDILGLLPSYTVVSGAAVSVCVTRM